jgi:hypothetical protein
MRSKGSVTEISGLIKEAVGFIRETAAIIHYFSIIVAAISIYNLIYGQSTAGAIIAWLVTALLSAIIAELLKSRIPTLLRIILHRKSIL